MSSQSWGVTTHKGNYIYLHVLSGDSTIVLPKMAKKIKTVTFLNGVKVKFKSDETGTTINIPPDRIDTNDTVIKLGM